jgi:hypothetical protein
MVMRCGYGDDNNKPVALRYVGKCSKVMISTCRSCNLVVHVTLTTKYILYFYRIDATHTIPPRTAYILYFYRINATPTTIPPSTAYILYLHRIDATPTVPPRTVYILYFYCIDAATTIAPRTACI